MPFIFQVNLDANLRCGTNTVIVDADSLSSTPDDAVIETVDLRDIPDDTFSMGETFEPISNAFDPLMADLCVKNGDVDDCCYAICDYEYIVHAQETEASHRSQLFLVSWCPDSARIKKMIYVASAE